MNKGGSVLPALRKQANIQNVYERIVEVQMKSEKESDSIYKQMREGKLR